VEAFAHPNGLKEAVLTRYNPLEDDQGRVEK